MASTDDIDAAAGTATAPSEAPLAASPHPLRARWARARAALSGVSAPTAYLIVALAWGLLLVVLVPPFQQFDEVAHFYRAWSLTNGQLTLDSSYEVSLPKAVADLPTRLDFVNVGEARAPYSPRLTLDVLKDTRLGPPVRTLCFAGNPNAIGYLPAAVGTGVARVLRLSPLAALYAARLANLLAAVIMVFFAIRLLPYGKPLFVLVGLLPMTVTQFASVNPDALTIAGAMLFFALVLRLSLSERLSNMALVALTAAAVILLNVKPGYEAFAFLGFLMPCAAFGSRRRRLAWMALLVAATFAVAALDQVLLPPADQHVIQALYGVARHVDPGAQTDLVLSHPGVFLDALRTSGGTDSIEIATNMVGILGRGFIPLSQMAVLLVLAVLVATLMTTGRRHAPNWWGRALIMGVCLVTYGVLALAMYIGSTSVGATTILGLQGRYFIPVLAVGLFAFYGLERPPRWVVVLVLALFAVALAASSLASLWRYYY